MTYLRLFWEFFKTGLFAVGGGMATVPFLKNIGLATGWYSQTDLMNMLAVSESTPGPIGINMATYVGFTVAGIPGAVIATIGEVTPSIIVILIVAAMLTKFRNSKYVENAFYGLRPASSGLIGAACAGVVLQVLLRVTSTAVPDSLFMRFSWDGTVSWMGLALAAVLLVGVITVGGYLLKIRAPELPNKDNTQKDPNRPQVDEIDYGDGVRPRVSGERKSKDFYTVLVLGRDTGGGGNTDTMLLASYDVTNQKATVMSIPRDTMVNVPWDVKKINSVYNYYGGGDKGIKALYKEISQLVGFEPDYQVIIEWDAVGAIVEAIGGVYFDVPYNMDYHDQYQDLVIEQEKGYRKLNGDDAMQVIRWRKNDSNSPYGNPQIGDSGRMQIQQDFLKAVIKQLLQLKNVVNPGKLAEVFRENVETDLSFENILWFGKRAVFGGLSLEDVSFMTMPWTGVYVYSRTLSAEYGRTMKLDYVVPQANALLDLVNDSLSPFTEKFTLRDLDIMSVNADGSLASSTGRVEDSKAAAAPPLFVDPYTGRIANSSESTGGETEENDPPAEVTSGSLTVIGEATGNE